MNEKNKKHEQSKAPHAVDQAMEDMAQNTSTATAGDGDSAPSDDVKTLQSQLADAKKKHLMAVAELDNFRKRTRAATEEQLRYANLPLISELLDAVDNLQRAIEAAEQNSENSSLLEGVKMVANQLSQILEKYGCRKIEAVGQPFDPNLHQALQMHPSSDVPPNTVTQELRPGFKMHDRVIRPSQVFVATGQNEQSDTDKEG